MNAIAHNPEFDQLFEGTLYSLLSWEQLASFWGRIDRSAGWYLYAVGEPCPLSPVDAGHVEAFIRHIDDLLRREHDEDYCGIVYADDLNHPHIIKIYDPNNLGTSCGSGKHRILPGWVMSLTPPSDLHTPDVLPQNRKRWWQGFMEAIGAASR